MQPYHDTGKPLPERIRLWCAEQFPQDSEEVFCHLLDEFSEGYTYQFSRNAHRWIFPECYK